MRKYTDTKQKSYAAGRRKRNARKGMPVIKTKMKLKKGDHVIVVSGKDKGKEGAILRVHPTTNRVLIEGVGMVKRHTRRSGKNATSRIIDAPATIHASNVMLLDPDTKKQTRVGRQMQENRLVRVAKKSNTVLK